MYAAFLFRPSIFPRQEIKPCTAIVTYFRMHPNVHRLLTRNEDYFYDKS